VGLFVVRLLALRVTWEGLHDALHRNRTERAATELERNGVLY
jgi:hypothetical protein